MLSGSPAANPTRPAVSVALPLTARAVRTRFSDNRARVSNVSISPARSRAVLHNLACHRAMGWPLTYSKIWWARQGLNL
jgi:hypothetical protein